MCRGQRKRIDESFCPGEQSLSSLIHVPGDRCPYPEGTDVFYWHLSPDGAWVKIESRHVPWRGRVGVITASTPVPYYQRPAPVGEKVIFIVTPAGALSGEYERFLDHAIEPNEQQRWFSANEQPK